MKVTFLKADRVFVHLSDIHFRKVWTGNERDLNREFRLELELDLRRLRKSMPRCDGVLVSGDIAYAGKVEEDEIALSWSKRVCELAGCDETKVMVIPDNHDVDRDVILASPILSQLHAKLLCEEFTRKELEVTPKQAAVLTELC